MSNMSNVVATPQSSADLSGDVSTVSSAATGMVITMNAFIDPSNQAAYLQALRPVLKALGENPENIFVVVSVSPKDAGHVRVMHGWKKDSAWFNETFYKQPYFQKFVEETQPMWIKPRLIEHFDLLPME